LVVVSVGILLATAACTGSGGGTSTGNSAPKTTAAAAKTYTATDLPPILTAAEKKLDITGTVLDNSQIVAKEKQSQAAGGIAALLKTPGLTVAPAACGQLFEQAASAKPLAGTVNSMLTYGSSFIILGTFADKQLPQSLKKAQATRFTKILGECSSMKISVTQAGQTVNIPITIKKTPVKTNADETTAIQETLTTPSTTGGAGSPTTVTAVNAFSGSLYITGEVVSTATTAAATSPATPTPSIAQVINAVIAAAK
jgi:hypothetical protein